MLENTEKICAHFGVCGGCYYLNIPYEEELKIKEAAVRGIIPPDGGGIFEGIHPAPAPSAYRNKMEFAFGDEGRGGALTLGIRKRRNFYEVARPDHCALIPDIFKQILQETLLFFRETNETFYHRRTCSGALRHLVLRRGAFTGEVLVNLNTTSALRADLTPLVKRLTEAAPAITGILHTVSDGVSDRVETTQVQCLWGRDYFYEKINGLTFRISPFSFFQTNSAGAERLYNLAADYAGPGEIIYDLYCGTGTIAQIVSKNAQKVVGVEQIAEAVRSAVDNAALNSIHNCEFITGDVLLAADELAARIAAPDIIIVDPPRDGLHPKALPKIAGLGAPRLVYISCKPASLARDILMLKEYGYQAQRLAAVDMFPRTVHVETVCLFIRQVP